MSTLISLVGKQPGAVATTAKTLIKNADLRRIVLLYTQGTEEENTRLMRYFSTLQKDFNTLEIESYVIATDLDHPGGYPFAWNMITERLTSGQLSESVYYDTSPGLNYQVALISYHLKNETRIIPLYADYENLYILGEPKFWELEDIGFKELLDLYGLQSDKGIYDDVAEDVTISGGAVPLKLHRACERKGRLHGLYRIFRGHTAQDREKEVTRIKQEARKIKAIIESPALLNNLQPRIVVWTNDDRVVARLTAYGVQTILKENDWKQKRSQPPGLFKPGQGESKVKHREESSFPEGHWANENLLVALGSDPSATLLAIFTHQPEEIILLFDNKNPWVEAIAGRVKEHRTKIPAKKITFWPMDIKGDISDIEDLIKLLNGGRWITNITPGTKGQTWNLARLNNVEIWSLNSQTGSAVSLISTQNHNPKPFSFCPISLQASINGGVLKEEGLSKEGLESQLPFFQRIINIISKEAQKHHWGGTKFDLPWTPGKRFPKSGENYFQCIEVANGEIEFEAHWSGQQTISGKIRCDDCDDPGKWLEEPIAAAFMLSAGKKEIKDMKIGVRWDWLDNKSTGDQFRTEIDIIILWRGHYIGVSCKRSGGLEEYLENHRAEIMAEARAGLGRFAIPILVRGNIPVKEAVKYAEESLKDGPLEIGLCLLNNGKELKRLVEKAIEKYHTLSQSSE